MRRRILSIVMSVIVLVNTYAMSISAEAAEAASGALSNYADGFESGFSLGNIETSSDNVLGGILAETIDEEIAIASEKAAEANRIIDVKVVDAYTMSVEFTADIDCTAIVAIYDETGVQMLTSGSIEVFADETQTYIDFDDIPDYFFLRAYLVETETMKPLSIQYESDLYTQDMQEFVNKTVDDFAQDKILNFDDDNTTNFAVYNDSTIIVEEAQGVNTIVLQDDENGVYEFADADESITNLVAGDVLSYEYFDNEVVLIKVDTINVDGNNVRITGTDIEKEDVFEYISVDTISDAEDAKVDTSYMDEDIEYLGLAEGLEENEQQTYASISGKKTLGFEFELKDSSKDDDEKFETSIKGKLNFAVTIKLEFKWSINKKYFDVELEYVAGFKDITINAKYKNKVKRFPEFSISPVAGVYITFKPSLIIEANASVKVNANLTGSIGFRIKGNGIENISKNPKFKTKLKLEGKVYIGISMEPKVKILSDYIANASMKAEAGVELSMKSCDESKNDMTVSIHDCKGCFEGEINSKFDLSASAEIAKVKFKIKAIEVKNKITDMYYSADFDELGFGTCPHIKYKVSVEVKDFLTNEPIEGVLVYDDDYITDKKGQVSFFVPNGEYKIVPVKKGYEYLRVLNTQRDTISVKNNSKKVSFLMNKTDSSGGGGTRGETENPEETEIYWPDKNKNFIVEPTKDGDLWWSIDEDGLLEIWGKGDYANADWTRYSDSIKTAKIVVSDITNCGYMFSGCRSLTAMDVSNFDTSKVMDMQFMFGLCFSLTSIDLSSFNTSNVTDMFGMFNCCECLTSIDLGDFDTSNVTNMRAMFINCFNLTIIDLNGFDTNNVTDMGGLFSGCKSLVTIDLSNFDTSKVTDMQSMFSNCDKLTTIDLSNFDTSNVTDMNNMFADCESLTTIDLSNFDTSNVTDMNNMFANCESLTTIDLSNFDTNNVTYMGVLFSGCKSLTTIDLSSFNTSNVTDMYNMFANCESLTTIDLSNFDTTKVDDMRQMFFGCAQLQTVYLDINPNAYTDGMFYDCPATVITPTTSSSLNKDDTYAIEKSIKPYMMLTTSYDEAQAESGKALEVRNTGNMTTKTFKGLKPNTVYNFYDMKDKNATEPYATDNMLFIIQATSDASGTIEINYIQREPYESSDAFVVPMQGYILFGQVESFSASSDTSQAVDIKLYNSNDASMNNAIYEVESTDGTYEIDDVGAGDYIMSVSKENHVTRCYNITISDSDTEQDVTICLKGDVTGDGKVNSQDLNTVRNHINYAAQITDEYKFKCADVTGDGRINSQDLNAIRNHINYENRFW
ncbi:MAG: BspA family leucine-rich repeat surface protein [Clostridium sp.]|nr:BspA family leucine-rich repeat surface protein [Clostridium sp.]